VAWDKAGVERERHRGGDGAAELCIHRRIMREGGGLGNLSVIGVREFESSSLPGRSSEFPDSPGVPGAGRRSPPLESRVPKFQELTRVHRITCRNALVATGRRKVPVGVRAGWYRGTCGCPGGPQPISRSQEATSIGLEQHAWEHSETRAALLSPRDEPSAEVTVASLECN
jgi:hypothetical protein